MCFLGTLYIEDQQVAEFTQKLRPKALRVVDGERVCDTWARFSGRTAVSFRSLSLVSLSFKANRQSEYRLKTLSCVEARAVRTEVSLS